MIRRPDHVGVGAGMHDWGHSGMDKRLRTARRRARHGAAVSGFAEPDQLRISRGMNAEGCQVVCVTGELDIATAGQVYDYLSELLDHGSTPVCVDVGGLTFCDASGLGVLARAANKAREAGRQLRLISARPSLLRIMRITGLDSLFPELGRMPA